MDSQEKWLCPACGKAIKVGLSFCTNCGANLSEYEGIETTFEAPPEPQNATEAPLPVQVDVPMEANKLIEGWEVSPDRVDYLEKILSTFPLGDPIITSKCKLDRENGLLAASENGFAWRIKMGFTTGLASMGKNKWVRWHDMANIIPKKEGVILVEMKIRKNGSLILNGMGNPKKKKWKLTIQPNKGEQRPHFIERQQSFNGIMTDLMNKYKGDTDPPTSDSVM